MTQNAKYYMIVGTYTSPCKSQGLYVYQFDSNTAEMKYESVAEAEFPSLFTLTRNQNFLYAVSEIEQGRINAFAFDSKKGILKFLNSQPSGSSGPTYISVDDHLIASYNL